MQENQDYVYCLAASPSFRQDGLVFAAKKSGLYKSTDRGKTWSAAYATLKLSAPLPTTSAAVSVVDDITYVFAAVEGRVLRSLDAGLTWQIARLESPAPLITSLDVSPNFTRDGLLLAGTMQDGIFLSTDRGVTWQGWNFGLYDSNINALSFPADFTGEQAILAGAQSGVFVSVNGGRSWRDLDFPITAGPVVSVAVSVDQTFYAGTESRGLYRSEDAGATWKRIQTGAVEYILLDGEKQILILRKGELLFSKDFGKSWHSRRMKSVDSDISCLCAPLGLKSANPLVVGLANGEIIIQ